MAVHRSDLVIVVFIFGTACQIYCCGRYCVTQSVSPKVPENPSGPLVDNCIVLPCVACGVACVKLLTGRGPLKQSWWPESNWTLPLRSVGVAASSGWFRLVFWTPNLRNVPSWRFVSSDSYGKQEMLNCFTVYSELGGSAEYFYVTCCDGS